MSVALRLGEPLSHDGQVTSTGGFVQMMVLVALGTISAAVTAAILSSTTGSRSFAALERLVETDALAISGFNRLEAAMLDPADDLEGRALEPNAAVEIAVGRTRISVQIEGLGGKIDPLKTDRDVVARYLANAQLPTDGRTKALAAIDGARTINDTKAGYEALLVALLDQLPAQEIERDFTGLADHSGIDPLYASPRVIAAIPDLSASDAARIAGAAAGDRAHLNLQSRYFAPNGARFALLARIDWGANQSSQRRLPVEVSSAGRLVGLAGPS